VIISSAIRRDNPEVQAARAAGIPVVRRANMLAEITRLKYTVCIAGTHGKTTTTSLVACLLDGAGIDPTVINGGIIHAYGSNYKAGESDWMVVESDESDGTFTKLYPTCAIVTNIDPEHMDHYGTMEKLREAFDTFVENLPFYGFAVLCTDHPEVQALAARVTDRRRITYGFNLQADVRATNLTTDPQRRAFRCRDPQRGRQAQDHHRPDPADGGRAQCAERAGGDCRGARSWAPATSRSAARWPSSAASSGASRRWATGRR
jgi:UDP-N-acetylmuramate--alanine ligase